VAYANVQNSGKIHGSGSGLNWTPGSALTVNNLLTYQTIGFALAGYVPGATDAKDSSGTPKTLTLDVSVNHVSGFNGGAGVYSLVIPSGTTNPWRDTNASGSGLGQNVIWQEWSGNATTSVIDATKPNDQGAAGGGKSANTGAGFNTGANAGLVLACLMVNGNTGNPEGIAVTGTNFLNDAIDQNGASSESGAMDHRITSAASQTGLQDTWTWTAENINYLTVIASYNAAAGGGFDPSTVPWQPQTAESANLAVVVF
jgi:hypothetical protein